MQVLRLKRKTESKIELAELLIKTYCLMSMIKIGKTELIVLAYFMNYGFKQPTKDLILKSMILKSYNSLENCLTRLRKLGLVTKNALGFTCMCPSLTGIIDNRMGIIIELKNA